MAHNIDDVSITEISEKFYNFIMNRLNQTSTYVDANSPSTVQRILADTNAYFANIPDWKTEYEQTQHHLAQAGKHIQNGDKTAALQEATLARSIIIAGLAQRNIIFSKAKKIGGEAVSHSRPS